MLSCIIIKFIVFYCCIGASQWLCVLVTEFKVEVMDSASKKLNQATILQIAKIVTTDKPFFKIERFPVQQQCGTADCCLFAIAFAVGVCIGSDAKILTFEQMKRQKHLFQCREQRKMSPFPSSLKSILRSLPKQVLVNVYCICRLHDFFDEMMIQCELCNLWYHYKCVDIKKLMTGNV